MKINKKASISLFYQLAKGLLIGFAIYGAAGVKTLLNLVWLLVGVVYLTAVTGQDFTELTNILTTLFLGLLVYHFLRAFKKLRGTFE
jgi:hypothetical protein